MRLNVKAVTKESRQAQGKTYWSVKHDDGNWYNLITDSKPSNGASFEVEVKTNEYNGKTYRWANIAAKQEAHGQATNGHILWEDYALMARAAHELACEFEPDETGTEAHFEDRSQARAAIVNTVMIAFANGKLALPKDEQSPPEAGDMPF